MIHKLLSLLGAAALAVPAFAQDDCASALAIDLGLHTVYQVDGNEVPMPICATNGNGATAGEWYTYTPTEDIALTVTTDVQGGPSVDTRFHVYTGVCGNLTCVAGDDDSGSGLTSTATFNVDAGTTYIIAFDNRWTSTGFNFQLLEQEPIETLVSFVSQALPVNGTTACVVDMNNDMLDDVVSVQSTNLRINYQQPDGSFLYTDFPHPAVDNTPGWSICAGDLDNNGFNDLLYAGSGGSFMFANDDGTAYTEVSDGQWIFCQRSNIVDINNDGINDGFICHDVQPNVFYIHDGNQGMTWNQGGLGDTPDGGNYGSVWIDYDNDCDMDLFIAKCRGGESLANINQMHRNNGDGTFTDVSEEIGLADNVQTWSSAWGDFDNDGDMDVLVGASSFTNGGHKLMRNNGDGTFTDVSVGSGYDTFNATSIEWAPGDFNNDGYVDVMGGGSTIMINNGDMTFTQSPVAISTGSIGDLNNDGFLDIFNGSMYLNQGNDNNYIKVHLKGNESNYNGIGARIKVSSSLGTQIRDIRSGEGFRYMSTLTAHFGLGEDTDVERIEICWPSGTVDIIEEVDINTTLVVEEGTFVVSMNEVAKAPKITLYPNPASDFISILSDVQFSRALATITDIDGRRVMQQTLSGNVLNVSELSSGFYLLQLEINGRTYLEKFIVE